MRNFVFLALIYFLSIPCFAQDDGFMEEFIDLDLGTTQIQKEEKITKESDETQNKTDEFNAFKKQNEKEISVIEQKIYLEEDGIVRMDLENQIMAKKIEYKAKQYSLDWADNINELKIQEILKEALKVKKQMAGLLDDYENLLETKNDFMIDKNKISKSEDQDYVELEESIIIENKNKVLILMINTLKPFIQKLNRFQNDCFKSENGGKIKISSFYKSGSSFIGLKIIYTSEQTVIYNLKYNISDFDKEDKSLVGKSSKEFTITPVFSVTQNNNGTLAKVLTGFNVKNSVVENEQTVKIPANIKEIFEIDRYKKMLAQYNE